MLRCKVSYSRRRGDKRLCRTSLPGSVLAGSALLTHKFISMAGFRDAWSKLEWEQKLHLVVPKSVSCNVLMRSFLVRTKGTMVGLSDDLRIYEKVFSDFHSSAEEDALTERYASEVAQSPDFKQLTLQSLAVFHFIYCSVFGETALLNLWITEHEKHYEIEGILRSKAEEFAAVIGKSVTQFPKSFMTGVLSAPSAAG